MMVARRGFVLALLLSPIARADRWQLDEHMDPHSRERIAEETAAIERLHLRQHRVVATVAKQRARLLRCHARAAAAHGWVRVTFAVTRHGVVEGATLERDETGNGRLAACVLDAVRALRVADVTLRGEELALNISFDEHSSHEPGTLSVAPTLP